MHLNKNNVLPEDKKRAVELINALRGGTRVFGSPAQALKIQLKELEKHAPEEDSADSVDYNLDDSEYKSQLMKIKAGIKGEEGLADYFKKIIKLDPTINDMLVFASLGDTQDLEGKDYISDTDFICLYGKHLLCVDAKNVKTTPKVQLFVQGNGVFSEKNEEEPIYESNPQTSVWKTFLGDSIQTYEGITCIINKSGANICKDVAWNSSPIRPVHISELYDYIIKWVRNKTPDYDLATLLAITSHLVTPERSGLNLSRAKRLLGV